VLDIAIKAGLPLISCKTSDPLNFPTILGHLTHGNFNLWNDTYASNKIQSETFYIAMNKVRMTKELYNKLIEVNSSLICVNLDTDLLEAFDAGEVQVPKEVMVDYLKSIVDEGDIPDYLRCVTGLTIKQMVELIRITQAIHGSMSPTLMMKTRAHLIGKIQGLNQVEILEELYDPPKKLEDWCKLNKRFFVTPPDERLTPRGILFYGYPGVGKTQAAKYIATQFGVPLYRLDLSSSLGKYVGESESNLSRILSTLDQEEPCVVLLDEIEKLFSEKEDQGVTSRLLSQLLWWLQEHRSRVFVVMTTNDITKLPGELYRTGRIDQKMEMSKLSVGEALVLASKVLKQFDNIVSFDDVIDVIKAELEHKVKYVLPTSQNGEINLKAVGDISHADVVGIVHQVVKEKAA
jgi:hypothetical protein